MKKERRTPSDDVVIYQGGVEYHCGCNEEAVDLSKALNDAPESTTDSWDDFFEWAKNVNHPLIKKHYA